MLLVVCCRTTIEVNKDHLFSYGKETSIDKFAQVGLRVITPNNTKIGKRYKLGSFDIIPLPATHNIECRSYLIKADGDYILFATDTSQLPKVNVKVDYYIIEVNYLQRLREQAIINDADNLIHLRGIFFNHNSLEETIDYFESLDYKPKKIITIHKSNSGLFDTNEVIEALKPYANEVFVAENNTKFILEEI